MLSKTQEIVSGAEMIARAAMDAGVNFFAGYPITPASSIYSAMLDKLQDEGKPAIGASDEISAIAMCIGASMRGAKSMTATAAPGLSLMIESIGYAFATETPILIVLGQRLGPSTGAATQSAEGDISFVAQMISGGYNIPVIAPNSIANCYETTIKAINISEKYRVPVILLTEKDVIMSSTNIDADFTQKQNINIIKRKEYPAGAELPYKTYNFNLLNEVPDFVAAGASEHRVVATASVHDKAGNLSKTSTEALDVLKHLAAKIEDNIDDFSYFEFSAYDDMNYTDNLNTLVNKADITVISFLATDSSAREAVFRARSEGLKVNHLTLFTLLPLPKKIILAAVSDSRLVVIPEENLSGQYAEMIRGLIDIPIKKLNIIGKLISPNDIYKLLS